MKFEITNRFTGRVQFTAEIEADRGGKLVMTLGRALFILANAQRIPTEAEEIDRAWATIKEHERREVERYEERAA